MAFKTGSVVVLDIQSITQSYNSVDFMDAIYYYGYGMTLGYSFTDTQIHLRKRKVIRQIKSTLPAFSANQNVTCLGLSISGVLLGTSYYCDTGFKYCTTQFCTPTTDISICSTETSFGVWGYDTYMYNRTRLLRFCNWVDAQGNSVTGDNCLAVLCIG